MQILRLLYGVSMTACNGPGSTIPRERISPKTFPFLCFLQSWQCWPQDLKRFFQVLKQNKNVICTPQPLASTVSCHTWRVSVVENGGGGRDKYQVHFYFSIVGAEGKFLKDLENPFLLSTSKFWIT